MINIYFFSSVDFDNYVITDKDITISSYNINAFMFGFFFKSNIGYRSTNLITDIDISLNIEPYTNKKTFIYSVDPFHIILNRNMKIDLIISLQEISDNRKKFNIFDVSQDYAEIMASIINISLYE